MRKLSGVLGVGIGRFGRMVSSALPGFKRRYKWRLRGCGAARKLLAHQSTVWIDVFLSYF